MTTAVNPVVSVTLTPEQATVLGPLLDEQRTQTGVVGLLGTITRSFRWQDGRVTVQLQLVPLTRRLAAVLNRVTKKTTTR
jgi:hypothetical protein